MHLPSSLASGCTWEHPPHARVHSVSTLWPPVGNSLATVSCTSSPSSSSASEGMIVTSNPTGPSSPKTVSSFWSRRVRRIYLVRRPSLRQLPLPWSQEEEEYSELSASG